MKFLAYFRSLAAKFFHRSQIDDDMEEELGSHIQHRADDLERSGLQASSVLSRATQCWSLQTWQWAGYRGDEVPAMQRRMIECNGNHPWRGVRRID